MKETSSKSLVKSITFLLLFPLSSLGQIYDVETTYDPWTNSSKSTIKKRESPYGRESYRPNIKPFTPDYKSLERSLNARSTQQSASRSTQQKSNNRIISPIEEARLRWNADYNPTNNARRLEHANLIRNYHKSLIKTTTLPKAVNKPGSMYSNVFIVEEGNSMNTSKGWNDQGTLVYSGKAYYSFNQYYGAYEIKYFEYNTEQGTRYEIFKRNNKYTHTRTKEKIKYARENVNANPCPMNYYLNKPIIINSNGKVMGAFTAEYIVPECIRRIGKKGSGYLNQFEVYFIEDLENIKKAKVAKGRAFLAENAKKDEVISLPSGLQYKIINKGNGTIPIDGQTVKTHYKGTLINGKQFDSSYDRGQPARFKINGIIPGLTEALKLMPVGSKWELYIPPHLAYGERAIGTNIPANSTLIFTLELLEIVN